MCIESYMRQDGEQVVSNHEMVFPVPVVIVFGIALEIIKVISLKYHQVTPHLSESENIVKNVTTYYDSPSKIPNMVGFRSSQCLIGVYESPLSSYFEDSNDLLLKLNTILESMFETMNDPFLLLLESLHRSISFTNDSDDDIDESDNDHGGDTDNENKNKYYSHFDGNNQKNLRCFFTFFRTFLVFLKCNKNCNVFYVSIPSIRDIFTLIVKNILCTKYQLMNRVAKNSHNNNSNSNFKTECISGVTQQFIVKMCQLSEQIAEVFIGKMLNIEISDNRDNDGNDRLSICKDDIIELFDDLVEWCKIILPLNFESKFIHQ